MSVYDETEAAATAEALRASDPPYHERVELLRNARGELAAIEDRAHETDPPAVPTVTPHAEPSSLEDRLTALERRQGLLVPEQQRQADLDRLERQAQEWHGLSPSEAVQTAYNSARRTAIEALGADGQRYDQALVGLQAEEIMIQNLGEERWVELRPRVVEVLHANPKSWEVEKPTPQAVAAEFMVAARMVVDSEHVKSQTAETRRQAQTLSGQSSRPAAQTDDEQYWERVKSASTGGYGS